MAKIKKKIAEKVLTKKSDTNKKTINPFEVHINKQKHNVLGQKVKNDRGLPGVSRAKAIKKRKRTLLPEYNIFNKTNKFVDRRIGEKDNLMTEEDRNMARFTVERIKFHSKKSMYNLADDEILTHRGQTLNDIEKFDDPRSDDDDDEDLDDKKTSGNLKNSFVEDAHFGGGILSKTGKEGAKSHKDIIDQLIADSKKRKLEKQRTKEQTLELTQKLDKEWKDLIPLINKKKDNDEKPAVKPKVDDYDKVMRELIFEARGKPSDPLKSEDELAKAEKERLEKLEQDRLNRMRGFTETSIVQKMHRGADDLDDDFVYESDPEIMVAYDVDGKIINNDFNLPSTSSIEPPKDESENETNENEEDEESSEAETEDDLSDLKESESDSDVEQKEEEKENTNTNTAERKIKSETSENETENSDKEKERTTTNKEIELKLKAAKDEIENTSSKKENISNINKKERKRKLEPAENETENSVNKKEKKSPENNESNEKLSEIIEKAKKELPYTYKLPESYEDLQSLLINQPPEYQGVIIERMIKCNHPSLATDNKEKLGRLFVYLLQHLNDIVPDNNKDDDMKLCFSILHNLTPHLYNLTQLNPQNALYSLIEVIKEKQNDYIKKIKKYPGVDVLIFLKLISCLFSTSDFRHQVVTPTLVFIGQMLTHCRIKNRYDIAYGLFLVTLFLEYTTLSKRYMPAALIYLMGIIHMTVPKIGVRIIKIYPPFKPYSTELVLIKPVNKTFELKMCAEDLVEGKVINASFKLRSLYVALKLAEELHNNWTSLSSNINIFEPVYTLLNLIPKHRYPEIIKEEIDKFKTLLDETKKNKILNYIVHEKKKPKALKLYEPNIQKVYDQKKYKVTSKEKSEKDKLLHKYKKEMKGALREIRRDRSFLGRLKIKKQMESDFERKQKVKQIYAEASMQQGELNAMDRKKKRK